MSKAGYIMLYDCKDTHCVNYNNFSLQIGSGDYTIQGDYVIFEEDHSIIDINFPKLAESCQDYDCLNLESIEKPSIIIHKKYIHKLEINNGLNHDIEIEPTHSLSLNIANE